MNRSIFTILLLFAWLAASNVFWVIKLNNGVAEHVLMRSSLDAARKVALQSFAVISEAASENATRQSVIDAAVRVRPGTDPYVKEGFVWIGDIGLRFDEGDKLIEAKSAADPP